MEPEVLSKVRRAAPRLIDTRQLLRAGQARNHVQRSGTGAYRADYNRAGSGAPVAAGRGASDRNRKRLSSSTSHRRNPHDDSRDARRARPDWCRRGTAGCRPPGIQARGRRRHRPRQGRTGCRRRRGPRSPAPREGHARSCEDHQGVQARCCRPVHQLVAQ